MSDDPNAVFDAIGAGSKHKPDGTTRPSRNITGKGDYSTLDVVKWFKARGLYGRPADNGMHCVECPWEDEHTSGDGASDTDTVVWEAGDGSWPGFCCKHAHCHGRGIHDLIEKLGDADDFCLRMFSPDAQEAGSNGSGQPHAGLRVRAAPSTEPRWPDPPKPEAYDGIAGTFMELVLPHSEADPVALFVQFHIAVGCMLGRGPHFYVEDTIHRLQDFAVLVGPSAIARKGTALGRVKAAIKREDEDWVENHVTSGLSSGEGLIKWLGNADTEGRDDKRVLIVEEEFVSTLRVMSRDGNTLSAQIRQAWDSGELRVMTKNPLRASNTHVGILGHITTDELRRELTATEAGNGFGNRFLWVAAKRSQLLPDGGNLDPAVLNPVVSQLHKAREFAQKSVALQRNGEARELWHAVYGELSTDRSGLFGAVTSRAEAHVLRWSMRNAALDCSPVIRVEHLQAALAAWDYFESSAAYIFGDSLGDPIADQALRSLRIASAGLTRTEIYNMFGRNVRSERIGSALELLHRLGRARMEIRQSEGGGRPEERWFAQ